MPKRKRQPDEPENPFDTDGQFVAGNQFGSRDDRRWRGMDIESERRRRGQDDGPDPGAEDLLRALEDRPDPEG